MTVHFSLSLFKDVRCFPGKIKHFPLIRVLAFQ